MTSTRSEATILLENIGNPKDFPSISPVGKSWGKRENLSGKKEGKEWGKRGKRGEKREKEGKSSGKIREFPCLSEWESRPCMVVAELARG